MQASDHGDSERESIAMSMVSFRMVMAAEGAGGSLLGCADPFVDLGLDVEEAAGTLPGDPRDVVEFAFGAHGPSLDAHLGAVEVDSGEPAF